MEQSYGFLSNFFSKQTNTLLCKSLHVCFVLPNTLPNSYHKLQSTLMLENLPNLWQKYRPVSRFMIPNTLPQRYHILQSTLTLENSLNIWQKYDPVSRFLIPNSYHMLQSTLMLEIHQIYGKNIGLSCIKISDTQ